VGGSHALVYYTGIARQTKDFDIFIRRADVPRALSVLSRIGCRTEITFPHWLAKAFRDESMMDIIFCSGNGLAEVDDVWFEKAPHTDVLGLTVPLCPAEEMIWSKAFIMERERFDGADVAHLLLCQGPVLDWDRLIARFGRHWRVLLSHVILFGWIYPSEKSRIPQASMRRLQRLLDEDVKAPDAQEAVTNGPLISRAQYLVDLAHGQYSDGRVHPENFMTSEDLDLWTRVIAEEVRPHGRIERIPPHRRRR
jgi:hypothetical protein